MNKTVCDCCGSECRPGGAIRQLPRLKAEHLGEDHPLVTNPGLQVLHHVDVSLNFASSKFKGKLDLCPLCAAKLLYKSYGEWTKARPKPEDVPAQDPEGTKDYHGPSRETVVEP